MYIDDVPRLILASLIVVIAAFVIKIIWKDKL